MTNRLAGSGVSVTSLRRTTSTEVAFIVNVNSHDNWYDYEVVTLCKR